MGSRFLSRKFIITLIMTLVGLFAAFILPAWSPFRWLGEHTPTIFAALCGLVIAYLGTNAWQKRKLLQDNQSPDAPRPAFGGGGDDLLEE